MNWTEHRKIDTTTMRPYVEGEDLSGVIVADNETPAKGGWIARNKYDHIDQWYVAEAYYKANYEQVTL